MSVRCPIMKYLFRNFFVLSFVAIALPSIAQSRPPATRVIWEGESNGRQMCKLDNGAFVERFEGPCSERIGLCKMDSGSIRNCSDCYPYANCRPF